MYDRTRRILSNYPYIHLLGDWYLVRRYTYRARKWSLWVLKKDKP